MRKILLTIFIVTALLFAVSCTRNMKEAKGSAPAQSGDTLQSESIDIAPSDNNSEILPTWGNNADCANRWASGIADGYDGIIYMQDLYEGDHLYALYSLNIEKDERVLLAEDCGGKINATAAGVYYLGFDERGIFRYDYDSGQTEKLYAGDVDNFVICEDAAFIVIKDTLYRMLLSDGSKTKVDKNVDYYYLDIDSEYVYYSCRYGRGEDNYKLFRIGHEPGAKKESLCKTTGPIIKYLDGKVVYLGLNEVYCKDVQNDKELIHLNSENFMSVAANGKYIYYTEQEDVAKLHRVYIDSGEDEEICVTHYSKVYFMNSDLYIVATGSFFHLEKINIGNHTTRIVKD